MYSENWANGSPAVTNETEPKCQTSSRILTDTQGLEVVLGVGDRWTVTSAIPAAAAHTSVTSGSEAPGHQTLFWVGTTVRRAPEVISLVVAWLPRSCQAEQNRWKYPVFTFFKIKVYVQEVLH